MNQNIDTIKKTRHYLLQLLKDATLDQLNEVPPSFNNNIIWNLAHVIAAQQGMCYVRAGQKTYVDEAFFLRYKPDTRPQGFKSSEEVEEIKSLLFSSLDQFEEDYKAGLFVNYNTWTNRYGTTLASIDDALQFFS